MEELRNTEFPRDQVKKTSTGKPYVVPGRGRRVVLVDFGAKHGILRELTKRDCQITVVPYNYSAEDILRLRPDGIMLTNGPGDPKDVPEAIEMVKGILGKVPIFGSAWASASVVSLWSRYRKDEVWTSRCESSGKRFRK